MAYIGLAPLNVATANVVNSGIIADQSVLAVDIADGAITESKIGSGAVTVNKIGSGAVTSAKLDTNIAVTGQLTAGNIQTTGLITAANIQTTGNVTADNYIGVVATPSISSQTLTLDCSSASIFEVSLNSNINTLNVNNVPLGAFGFVLQLNITGSYTVTWPASVKWAQNTAPTLTTTNGRTDTFTFITTDGGTTLYGIVSSQNALTA